MNRRRPETFDRSMPLEEALTLLFGLNRRKPTQWQGSAGMFCERKNVSKAVQSACRPLRKSIRNNIIADGRLQALIQLDLDGVERTAKKLGSKDGALVDCIGYLIKLSGHLLGYDADRGKLVRHLFYVYTKHRYYDYSLVDPRLNPPIYNKRVELINQMWKEGMKIEEIASIMNLAIKSVDSSILRIRDSEEAQQENP